MSVFMCLSTGVQGTYIICALLFNKLSNTFCTIVLCVFIKQFTFVIFDFFDEACISCISSNNVPLIFRSCGCAILTQVKLCEWMIRYSCGCLTQKLHCTMGVMWSWSTWIMIAQVWRTFAITSHRLDKTLPSITCEFLYASCMCVNKIFTKLSWACTFEI